MFSKQCIYAILWSGVGACTTQLVFQLPLLLLHEEDLTSSWALKTTPMLPAEEMKRERTNK
jgi:hypothetical protein